MKAFGYHRYGSPDVLTLQDADIPSIGDDDLLVRVRAAAVNPWDWHHMRGKPYFMRVQTGLTRPKANRLGIDMAGQVEAVGGNVTAFQPGDEVFGFCEAGFAEYVKISKPTQVRRKPTGLTFEQAAAVPVASGVAMAALRDKVRVRAGQRVLVNGAAGGIGTFAVQIAKAMGAEVTGVCGAKSVDLVRSIGADHVIDYTKDDFTRIGRSYDALIDLVGNRSLTACRRALTPRGTLVAAGAGKGQWIRPVATVIKLVVVSPFAGQRLLPFLYQPNGDDLAAVSELIEAGSVTPVIDRIHSLPELPHAIGYVEEGHAHGKVVITL
jgi:NADPH:quinone reductase-like Zn-dependent oxidoreductase